MLIYWLLLLWPTYAAYNVGHTGSPRSKMAYWGFALILVLVIGLRYKVGPDWYQYVENMNSIAALRLDGALHNSEPAYWFLNWIAHTTHQGIWVVNLACAALYVTGIFCFCRTLHNPWLGLMVAVPFMVVVIGMNYPRQSAALGFVLLGLVALQKNQVLRFIFLVALGALFHVTAAAALPFVLFAGRPGRHLKWILAGIVVLGGLLCSREAKGLIGNYVKNPMVSGGTVIRVLLNTLAAACVLLRRDRIHEDAFIRKLWTRYALSAIPFLAAVIVLPPLTVIDRLAFYWMPLQIFAFANLPDAMHTVERRRITTIAIIVSYALVMFVWFTFGNYNYAWRPYRFYPFE